MKYQIVVDTPKGVIFGKVSELTEDQVLEVKEALNRIVQESDRFSIQTEEGEVFMSEQMIRQSLFMLMTVKD